MLQIGGTFKKARGADQVTLNGVRYTVAELRDARKATHTNKTLRQLARSYPDEIAKICRALKQAGNLAANIVQKNSEYDKEGLTPWMSDFQISNKNCPEQIRAAIREQLKSRLHGVTQNKI